MKKILVAIGGFFAKIGRWIANTAWVQPLLIVGGIFAIIFSIPYIKQGIENAQLKDTTDAEIQYYKDRAISLTDAETHTSDFDKLLTALEDGDDEYVKDKYGEKFFISFGKEDCSYCKEGVEGFQSLNDNFTAWGLDGKFNFVTVMLDTTNDDGDYLAKMVFEEHQNFFDNIVGEYAEYDDYALLNNVSDSQKTTIINAINKLENAIDDNGEGLETPTTFFVDLTAAGDAVEVNPYHVTAIFFNYVDLLSSAKYNETTAFNKGKFLSDVWTYSKLFEKDWARNNA